MKNLEGKFCRRCEGCFGSGLEPVEDSKEIVYIGCGECGGCQCLDKKTSEVYCGECDESCGYSREWLKENWDKF